jgi:hypothetical protein
MISFIKKNMKTILTNTFIFLVGGLFAQNAVTDLSDILLEKRDKIAENHIYIQQDGSFQLITQEHFYKFDSNGKPVGTPEENKTPESSYKNGTSDPLAGYLASKEIYYNYNGNGHLTLYKLNSGSTNELTDISFPPLESVGNVLSESSGLIHFVDDENVVLILGYAARSGNSHKEAKTPKGVYNSFIRVIKANIKTKEVEDSFHFIDKITGPAKQNDIRVEINALKDNKVNFGVFVGVSVGAQYEPKSKIQGTYQLWELDLESKEETKISEVEVKTSEKTRYAYIFFGNSGFYSVWTEEILKSNNFALFASSVGYKNGEWSESKVSFPADIISIKFPGAPIIPSNHEMKDGSTVYYIQGDFAKTKQDKTVRNRLVILNDAGEVTFKDMHTNVDAWSFSYKDGDKLTNYVLDNELTKEELDRLGEPLLKKSAMNYLYKGSGISSCKVGNELMLVHYDWRATNGKPDYMIQVTKLAL